MSRAAWEAHPNFEPVPLKVLRSHDRFRERVGQMREAIRIAADPRSGATERGRQLKALEAWFADTVEVLIEHHHVEDTLIFPFLASRVGFRPLELDHQHVELLAGLQGMADAVGQACAVGTPGAVDALAEPLLRFCEALEGHLAHEEPLLIPALLQLDPAQQREMFEGTGRVG